MTAEMGIPAGDLAADGADNKGSSQSCGVVGLLLDGLEIHPDISPHDYDTSFNIFA